MLLQDAESYGLEQILLLLPPNMPPRCHSMGVPFSPSLNTTPKLSSAMSILPYARSRCSVRGWPRPPWIMMKMGRRTSRPHTPPYATWLGERRVARANWLLSEWRPPGEVWPGGCLPKWTLVRRSPRPWRRSTLTGGHSSGCKWPPKVLSIRRSCGMNFSHH